MKSQLKRIKDCRYALSIEVEPQVVDGCYQEVLEGISRKVKIKGFRPGKAPLNIVGSAYEADARQEVIQKLVSQSYAEALQEHEVRVVSYPTIRDLQLSRGEKMKFVAQFDVWPEVKLKNYQGLKLQKESSEITETQVEEALKSLQTARAKMAPIEVDRPVEVGDYLVCQMDMIKEGKVVQSQKDVMIHVHEDYLQGLWVKHMPGMKIGEIREVPFPKLPDKADAAEWIYRIQLTTIQYKVLAPLDDEFAKGFGKETIQELRQSLRSDLQSYKNRQIDEALKQQVYEKLLQDNKFAVPESLVERQKESILSRQHQHDHAHHSHGPDEPCPSVDKKGDKEAVEKAEKDVRLYYILEKIAEDHQLKPDDSEIDLRIHQIAAQVQLSPDQVRERFVDDIRHEIKSQKVVDYVISQAKTN